MSRGGRRIRILTLVFTYPTGFHAVTSHVPARSSCGTPTMLPLVGSMWRPGGRGGETSNMGQLPVRLTGFPLLVNTAMLSVHTKLEPNAKSAELEETVRGRSTGPNSGACQPLATCWAMSSAEKAKCSCPTSYVTSVWWYWSCSGGRRKSMRMAVSALPTRLLAVTRKDIGLAVSTMLSQSSSNSSFLSVPEMVPVASSSCRPCGRSGQMAKEMGQAESLVPDTREQGFSTMGYPLTTCTSCGYM
mmetsp:Transcript_25717/g.57821  ORF Transcript_25717/g.57821 Transcript_25717/m.57821 type:complete len:245 (-) Transcript_25717:1453-2187(-)